MGVIIGVDPHKASCTAAVLDERGELADQQRFASTRTGSRGLRRWARRWPERRWAVEGASGLGRTLTQQLVGQGEPVVDVPAKLAARVRLLSERRDDLVRQRTRTLNRLHVLLCDLLPGGAKRSLDADAAGRPRLPGRRHRGPAVLPSAAAQLQHRHPHRRA
jgi:hypothetical protein